jgi:hypothetical protein
MCNWSALMLVHPWFTLVMWHENMMDIISTAHLFLCLSPAPPDTNNHRSSFSLQTSFAFSRVLYQWLLSLSIVTLGSTHIIPYNSSFSFYCSLCCLDKQPLVYPYNCGWTRALSHLSALTDKAAVNVHAQGCVCVHQSTCVHISLLGKHRSGISVHMSGVFHCFHIICTTSYSPPQCEHSVPPHPCQRGMQSVFVVLVDRIDIHQNLTVFFNFHFPSY